MTVNNPATKLTRLEAVHPGDVLTLQHNRFTVLTAQRDAGLVTLELQDTADKSSTLIGVATMQVTIE